MGEVLDYEGGARAVRFSWLGLAALVLSFHPVLWEVSRTRPFWTGHSLEKWGRIVDVMLPLRLSIPLVFVLSVVALIRILVQRDRLRGVWVASAAVAVSGIWLLLMMLMVGLMLSGEPLLPHPGH